MTINTTRRFLFLASRFLGDVNSVKRGRVGPRITNRVMGRFVSKSMRRVWR